MPQWSRGLSAPVTGSDLRLDRAGRRASMEPGPLGPGDVDGRPRGSAVEASMEPGPLGPGDHARAVALGIGSRPQWSRGLSAPVTPVASGCRGDLRGPQWSRGLSAPVTPSAAEPAASTLASPQWSRGLSAPVTSDVRPRRDVLDARASMEPGPLGPGDRGPARSRLGGVASMEPGPRGPGDRHRAVRDIDREAPQWSRGLSAPVTDRVGADGLAHAVPQWSRGLSAPVTRRRRHRRLSGEASMEPGPLGPGDCILV